jgi:hypothetical protein
MYFNLIGLVDYSAYIPITFEKIENKGLLLGPLIFILMILFTLLRNVQADVAGYFTMIAGVGLCLGGSYNTLASLVAM